MTLEPLCVGVVRNESPDRVAQLGRGSRLVVRLEHPGLCLEDLSERPEADALAIGQRASLTPVGELAACLDRLEELVDEPALADARHADERDELGLAILPHTPERCDEDVELLFPADERRAPAALHVDVRPGPQHLPDRNGLGLAFRVDPAPLAVFDRPVGRTMGRLVDEDPVDRGRGLKARSRVDDVARGHALAGLRPGSERDERLTRRDPDPHLQVAVLCPIPDGECRADGALGVVLVCHGRAEERHHRIADELLHRAAETLELGPDPLVVAGEQRADVLRVEALRLGRRADQVAEEHGDDLPLLPRRRRRARESRTAGAAEAEVVRALTPAVRTRHHGESVRRHDRLRCSGALTDVGRGSCAPARTEPSRRAGACRAARRGRSRRLRDPRAGDGLGGAAAGGAC